MRRSRPVSLMARIQQPERCLCDARHRVRELSRTRRRTQCLARTGTRSPESRKSSARRLHRVLTVLTVLTLTCEHCEDCEDPYEAKPLRRPSIQDCREQCDRCEHLPTYTRCRRRVEPRRPPPYTRPIDPARRSTRERAMGCPSCGAETHCHLVVRSSSAARGAMTRPVAGPQGVPNSARSSPAKSSRPASRQAAAFPAPPYRAG